MHEGVQGGLVGGQVRVVPGHLTRARRAPGVGERDRVGGVTQLEGLVDRDVEEGAVVIDAEATEDGGRVVPVQRVREPDAWLEGAVERVAVAAGADVPAQIELGRQRIAVAGKRVDHHLGRHVVVVHHLRLEVPPDAEVDR